MILNIKYMDDYNKNRDILGNIIEDPLTIEDDIVQEEDEPISLPIKIIGWVIAILIIGLVVLFVGFLFVTVFGGIDIFGIIIIFGLIGSIPSLILRGKF